MANTDLQPGTRAERNGTLNAEAELVRAFNELRDELLGTLLFMLGNREDAQDAAQEAFIKCWTARDKLAEIGNLRGWIFRVAFNTAKDMQRSAYRRRVKPLLGAEFMIADTPAPALTLEFRESMESLRKAIVSLRDDEKEVFLLRQNGELTYDQIAEMRHVPVSTVKSQMRAAVEKLRKMMA